MKLAVRAYTRFPVLREWAKNLRPGRRNIVKKTLRRAGVMPSSANIDHARSRLIPTNFGLRMWVNDRVRFGQGIVPVDEKEELLDEVSEHLLADRDPVTGEPIISATYRGSDVYHGSHTALSPDLIIEYNNSYDPSQIEPAQNPHIEGGHTLAGILLAHGPGVRQTTVEGSRLEDLAPTVLHLLGHSIPPDMDGRVLTGIFTRAHGESRPVRIGDEPARHEDGRAGADYTEDEEAEINEQLRQLGYI